MSGTYDMMNMIPQAVTVENCHGSRDTDILTYMLSKGWLFISGSIDHQMAMQVIAALYYLSEQQQEVNIILNSPGGEILSGLTIYDSINAYKHPVNIYCAGLAASMGALILAGGQKGRRFILPDSKVMIHEPLISGTIDATATTLEKTAQSILKTKAMINKILAEHTGKSVREIKEATQCDNYMTPEEAIEFGICDEIRGLF